MKVNAHTAVEPDLVVVGNLLIDGRLQRGHVLARDGIVRDVVTTDERYVGSGEVIDAGDDMVLPGAVDGHVHSSSHSGEGLLATTSAAAAGGVTTIVEMPFDGAHPINRLEHLSAKTDRLADEAVVDVALLGTLEPGGGWRRAAELVDAGVVGFKVSLFDTDPFRFPRISDDELPSVMRAVGEAGSTLCTHAENNEIIKALLAEESNRASTDPLTHTATRPPVSETLGILTAMEIAAHEGNALHLCHLSLGRSATLVEWYRSQGVDVTFETCPHYLVFTEDDMRTQRGRLKINPPLRTTADQDALWAAVASGRIPSITSDHAPWPRELKDRDRILDNASGVPGVQTLTTTTLGGALHRYGFGPEFSAAVSALTSGPADRYGFGDRKGRLQAGYDADFMFLRVDEEYRIGADEQKSNAGWTPYEGYPPGLRVTRTISRGTTVWNAATGDIGRAGRGRQVRRQ